MGGCSTHEFLLWIVRLGLGKMKEFSQHNEKGKGKGDSLFTSSSLPPHTSPSSWFSSSSTWSSSIRAFKRSSRVCSISLRRFSLRKSSVSSGVKKKVSSVSDGRSDQPLVVIGEASGSKDLLGSFFVERVSSCSSRRRASYLNYKKDLVESWVG